MVWQELINLTWNEALILLLKLKYYYYFWFNSWPKEKETSREFNAVALDVFIWDYASQNLMKNLK